MARGSRLARSSRTVPQTQPGAFRPSLESRRYGFGREGPRRVPVEQDTNCPRLPPLRRLICPRSSKPEPPAVLHETRVPEGQKGDESEAVAGRDAALKALVTDRGFAKPEEIAAAVLFPVGDDARHITGTDLAVDDGFSIG